MDDGHVAGSHSAVRPNPLLKIASQVGSSAARLVPNVAALSKSVLAAFVALPSLNVEGMRSSPSVA